jgi:hypothetical protein
MPIILCHVVDLVIVTIFNFQTTQVHFVQDWKIPVKFTFKVFSIFRKGNMLNFVLKLLSTWVSGSYKRLTVRDYHSIMYRVSGSYKRLTVRDYHSIMYRVSGSYKRLTVRDYHSIMYRLLQKTNCERLPFNHVQFANSEKSFMKFLIGAIFKNI